MRKYLIVLTSILCCWLTSCSVEPQPIEIGADECHRCKMIISNKNFGCELITKKGRVYKYDAIECLIPEVIEKGAKNYSHILVTDYFQPGQFFNAVESNFLISENLPSPMGAFLSAYGSSSTMEKAQEQFDGKVYNWESIVTKFRE